MKINYADRNQWYEARQGRGISRGIDILGFRLCGYFIPLSIVVISKYSQEDWVLLFCSTQALSIFCECERHCGLAKRLFFSWFWQWSRRLQGEVIDFAENVTGISEGEVWFCQISELLASKTCNLCTQELFPQPFQSTVRRKIKPARTRWFMLCV